ncbi:MAG TPA: DUF5317 family protein [Candidatus Paceibacterota bacterium]|nr:DUF5317 family protein [Candidatus Paceibacterota bacterium]
MEYTEVRVDHPGSAVAAAVGLSSLVLAVLGVFCRSRTFEERFLRIWPSRTASVLQIGLGGTVFWAAWHREASSMANIAAICAAALLAMTIIMMCRPVLPVFVLCGGIICNVAAMIANGLRMPVPRECVACAAHAATTTATRLWWLTDCIVLDRDGPDVMSAISVGDILIAIGFALIAARLWLPRLTTPHRLRDR